LGTGQFEASRFFKKAETFHEFRQIKIQFLYKCAVDSDKWNVELVGESPKGTAPVRA
jgi:hypothetical protein